MSKDRFRTFHSSPWLAWAVIGGLLLAVVGLLAVYVLRPGRSAADDAAVAAAIGKMDESQNNADARREEKRSAAALL